MYYFYRNVQWGHWFTYLHMYWYQSLIEPVYAQAACRSCAAVACCAATNPVFRPCWRFFTCLLPYDEKSHDCHCVQAGGAIFRHFQVRCCWIKIDSAVNLGEMPSSKFMQCVLWVIRLMKTVESICCAVCHTVTLPRLSDEWYAHYTRFEFWLLRRLTPAITNSPPPVLRRQQFVPSVSFTTHLSQHVCCSALAASR